MLRIIQAAATLGALGLLSIAVGLTWRDQGRLARRLEEMSAGLDALAEQAASVAEAAGQGRAPAPEVPSAVSLHGLAYFDDASRPAAGFPLTIRSVVDVPGPPDYVREATTDAAGRFDSGDLPPGRYQASFQPVDEEGNPSAGLFLFSSDEFDLSQRGERREVDLDVRRLDASVRFTLHSSPPIVEMRGEPYQLLPQAYLVTVGESTKVASDDGVPPKGPLARSDGSVQGYSHFPWNHPLSSNKQAEVKSHLEYLEGASAIASGRYSLVVRLDAYALRACPITLFCESFDHEVDHGDLDKGFLAGDGSLEAFG